MHVRYVDALQKSTLCTDIISLLIWKEEGVSQTAYACASY